jgi:hypothetical protein
MAVTAYQFAEFPRSLMLADITDLSAIGTTVKCCLLTNLAALSKENWEDYADVVADGNEVVGAGYVAGGAAITAKTVAEAALVSTFDGDNVSWAAATFTCRYAVVYDDTPAANADKKLISYVDLGADYGVVGGTFTLTWNVAGIVTVTVS